MPDNTPAALDNTGRASSPDTGPGTTTEVYVSSRNPHPKYHFTLDCTALDMLRERDVDPADVLDLQIVDLEQFLPTTTSRACRSCALHEAAVHMLPHRDREPVSFLSMTAMPPLAERAMTSRGAIRSTWSKSDISKVTPTGADRLRQIGVDTGYPVVPTVAGPALYGMIPTRAHAWAERNLRTATSPAVVDLPSADVVVTAWGLLCQQPPEMIRLFAAERYYDDPWELALMALTGAPIS